jgi:hypothetical protein
MKTLRLIIVFILYFNCSSPKISKHYEINKEKEVNILFIGNSLTYTNNLPKLVAVEAKQKGITVKTKLIAFPNYAILDHWSDGNVQKEIASKNYDYVIIQQGPSSQVFGKSILLDYGKKYSALCKENNTKLCYFMVWPSRTYYHTFSDVIKNHKEAATQNDAILLPVGEVWKSYFDTTKKFDYYSEDGFHSSLKGSEIAAKVIVQYLFEK